MKRDPTDPTVSTVVRMPRSMLNRLDEQAERRVLGRNKLIQLVLKNWLDGEARIENP